MAKLIQIVEGVTVAQYILDKNQIRIGRNPDSEIHIDDPAVSFEHAVIRLDTDCAEKEVPHYTITDLDSTNNTFINGNQIKQHTLEHNDIIRVGLSSFTFIDETIAQTDKTLKIRKSWIPGVYYTK